MNCASKDPIIVNNRQVTSSAKLEKRVPFHETLEHDLGAVKVSKIERHS